MNLESSLEKLSGISPAKRAKVIQSSQELLRRRREERLRYFKPTEPPNNDQAGFLRSTAKTRAIFGGNRSGKTEAGVADCLMFMFGEHSTRSNSRRPPVYTRYLAPSYEDGVKAIIHKKFKELAPRHLLKGGSWATAWQEKSRTLTAANGSLCRFFSYEQDVNKMGGDDCDAVYLDEHAPERMFIEAVARTTDRNGYLVLTMTPELGITWEEEKIIDASEHDPDIEFFMFTIFNNPYLSKEGIAQFEKVITDPRLREAKLYGRFVSLSGLVYPQFDKAIHVVPDIDVPKHWHQQFIIDPHHRKDTAMIWTAWDPDGNVCYVHRESALGPSAGGVPELAAHIRVKSSGLHIDDWIGDEAMGGEGLNIHGLASVLEQLNAEGIPVVGTNQASDKAFAAGVNKLRSMLMPDPVTKLPRLYFCQSCIKTIKQFMTYQYRKETIVDEELLREHVRNMNDDYPTCARYAVMAEVDQGVGTPVSGLEGKW